MPGVGRGTVTTDTAGLTPVAYGDGWVNASLPERTRIVQANPPLAPLPDLAAAIREAIANPIAHQPLSNLVGPKAKVTIAFDDPAVPATSPDIRATALGLLLPELERLGVDSRDVRLLCANALHRKWTRSELGRVIGPELALNLNYRQLSCHDAEDPEQLVHLGETQRGFEVEVNRAVTDSDLLIYLNSTWSPFNGGWKSVAVGLSSYRSIRYHHRPYPRASGKSVMDAQRSSFQKLVWELGDVITAELAKNGRRIFTIESVANNASPAQPIAVFAGHPPEVHQHTLQKLYAQQVVDVRGQSDVLICGLPNSQDPYTRYAGSNPILVADLGCAYAFGLYQERPLVREGGILILVHPCPEIFDELHHPSYVEFYRRLLDVSQDPFELWELFADDFAYRPEYVHKYRHGYAFHGVHPFFMWTQTGFARRHCRRILLAGARDGVVARRLGFEPFPSLEAAIAEAEQTLGADCSITLHRFPPVSIARVSAA